MRARVEWPPRSSCGVRDDSTAAAGNPLLNIRAGARHGRAAKGGHSDCLAGTLAARPAPLARASGRPRQPRRAAYLARPSDTFVDFEHGLNTAIKRLRDALGDSADTPRFIETLPRRGYRFIGAVESDPQEGSAGEQQQTSRTSRIRWMPIGLGTALLVSTVVMILTVVRPPASSDTAMTYLNVLVTPAEQLLTADALELPISYGRPTRTAIALSPDGRLLVFSGRRGDQGCTLYLRPFDKGDAIEVKGTEGAGQSVLLSRWRMDRLLGRMEKIKKVRADGEPIMDVCATSPTGRDQPGEKATPRVSGEIVGASWGSDDTIVFALPLGGLWQVAARGVSRHAHDASRRRDVHTGRRTCFPAVTVCSSPSSGESSTGTT